MKQFHCPPPRLPRLTPAVSSNGGQPGSVRCRLLPQQQQQQPAVHRQHCVVGQRQLRRLRMANTFSKESVLYVRETVAFIIARLQVSQHPPDQEVRFLRRRRRRRIVRRTKL